MDLHVIMHIPKTGGQTIREHLRAHLEPHAEFVHFGTVGQRDAGERGMAPWHERSEAERALARVLAGHHLTVHTPKLVPGERKVKYAGLFREPASRMVSHYNFNVEIKWERRGKAAPGWDGWIAARRRNFVSLWIKERFLARPLDGGQSDESLFKEISEALDTFWLLGTMSHFDAFVAQLYADIGVPPATPGRANVAGRNHPVRLTLNEEIQARVRQDHPVDCAIYDLVQQRVDAVFKARRVTNA